MSDDFSPTDYARGVLAGERTRLRPATDDDITTMERWWADPEIGVLQDATVKPKPPGGMTEVFTQWSANTDPGGCGFAVETLDGTFIGHAVLYGATLPVRAATCAIMLGPEHSGKGYGPDALRTLVNYGFQELGFNRIQLRVWSFNARAIAAYKKVGFVEEGRLREAVFHDGRYFDQVLMGLLAKEWTEPASTRHQFGYGPLVRH